MMNLPSCLSLGRIQIGLYHHNHTLEDNILLPRPSTQSTQPRQLVPSWGHATTSCVIQQFQLLQSYSMFFHTLLIFHFISLLDNKFTFSFLVNSVNYQNWMKYTFCNNYELGERILFFWNCTLRSEIENGWSCTDTRFKPLVPTQE